ncbi:HAMP domain-containing histidine kinase [Tropicibacter sp. R16_0]|uniref:sensor histidine kinase n=1 Tax=Tropicibacter sp. R16_0 TaxID=2821102 RepID=UPI001ADB0E7F|nr:HAMP domain-containing sensor histidine kinase [Tropicibacter sp. R16_0]MBO9450070.1 HAMP domain-containing histidine kinase [Tropicibacter sp. R16_0]
MSRFNSLFRLSALRQALVLLSLFSLISIIAWGGTYWLVQSEMRRAVDDRLNQRMEAAITALAAGEGLPTPEDGESIRLTDETEDMGFWTDPELGEETRYYQRQTPHGVLVLGENTERQEELRDILAVGMQLSLLGSLLAAGIAAVWMAQKAQKRLNIITDGLADIAQGQLDKRIVLLGNDDLSLVAGRINSTTARLEQAMTDMKVQSSNIAHDLRTPLARLRAEVETSLSSLVQNGRAVTEDDLIEALDQIDQITGTFEALLRLARIESGADRAEFTAVSLDGLIDRVLETFSPVVEAAGHEIKIERIAPASVHGDPNLLMQLLANLIQNALRYGRPGQTITLRCHQTLLSVSDEGPGIPFAERERVLQPLYQMESARQGEGFGLGLPLVQAIAELHDAEFSLADGPNGKGLTATIRFPAEAKL